MMAPPFALAAALAMLSSPAVQDGDSLPSTAFPPDSGPKDDSGSEAAALTELERLGELLRAESEPSSKTRLDDSSWAARSSSEPIDPLRPATPHAPDDWVFEAYFGGEQLARTGISANPGSLETSRLLLGAELHRRRESGADLRLAWNFESNQYRFAGAADVVPNSAQPVEDLIENRFGVLWSAGPDARWRWFADLELALGFERESEFSESLIPSGAVGVSYRDSDELALTVGVWATQELADSDGVLLLPIIGAEWDIDARTRLRSTVFSPRHSQPGLNLAGPGFELSRDLSANTAVFLSGHFQQRQYRLDDVGPLPEGAFREREAQLVVGVDWNPGWEWERLSGSYARLFAGSNFDRELTWFDAADDESASADVDGGLVFGLLVRLAF